MIQKLLPFPDRSREIYACDVVWGYFPLTEILHSPKQLDLGRNPHLPSLLNDRLLVLESVSTSEVIADNLNLTNAAREQFITSKSSEKLKCAHCHQVITSISRPYKNGDIVLYKKNLCDRWLGQRTVILFTNPSAQAGYDTRSIFKQSLTGLNSEFSFSYTSCLTKAEEPSLSYYLPIGGGRIIEFIPFPRVLVLCEMQSVLSRT